MLTRQQGGAVGFTTARHRIIAQRIKPVLSKRLAARVLLVAARVVEVLVGIALMLEFCTLLFMGETIGWRLEAVVFELYIAWPHSLAVVELAHVRALFQRAVAEVEEELGAGSQGCRIVSKDDAVLACFKLVEVEQPLFGCEAIEEVEVGLAVLHAVFALGVLVFQGKGVIGNAMLLQQDTEDSIGLLRLKDAGVLAQPQPPQSRFDLKAIAGTAKAAVPLGKLAHYPADPALQLAAVPHHQLARLVQHGAKVDIRLATRHLQLQVERPVQPLIQLETGHHEGALGQRPHLHGKLQSGLISHGFPLLSRPSSA